MLRRIRYTRLRIHSRRELFGRLLVELVKWRSDRLLSSEEVVECLCKLVGLFS